MHKVLSLHCYHATWKTRKVREKSLNLKIHQKIREKCGNFIKLTDWHSPIERTSCQCFEQNVGNLCLESHTCDFSPNLQKSTNYLLFNLQISANRLSDYCGIPQSLKFLIAICCKTLDCEFWIFGFTDSMIISKIKYV